MRAWDASFIERHFWLSAVAVTMIVFAGIAPTLVLLEFSNGAEALNAATAMEIRRGDSEWLVPSLQGQTRLAKPPLTAWITALSITDSTLRELSNPEPTQRNYFFQWLCWEVRWPGLLAGCIMLLATAQMGRRIGGPACGIVALVVAGSSLLFLRFSRYGTVDIQLAMWVALANAFLFEAILSQWRWLGCILAGAALAAAMLTKGPVALIQSVVPVAVWFICMHRSRSQAQTNATSRASLFLPALSGFVVFLALALPWFILVITREPGALRVWFSEITREGATESKPGHWYSYLSMVPYMAPWIVFVIGGGVIAVIHKDPREILPLFLLLVPILIMSLAKDRNERYLLPMLPAAAILAGIGVTELVSTTALAAAHWAILAALAVGFPVATMHFQDPWYDNNIAISAAAIGAAIVAIGVMQQKSSKSSLIYMTLLAMLCLQAIFIFGYRETREGRAELRPLAAQIVQTYPDAEVYNAHPRGKRPPPEMGVYLNRVLRWIDDPATLSAGDKPKVLLMLQEKAEPNPTPPAGWQLISWRKRDKDFWWAFVLPGKAIN